MKKILLLLILFLTGCTKYSDLNELAIIKSIGIMHNDEYTLYAEIIEEIDKENNPKMQVIKTNSSNIEQLFANLKLQINKEIYLSHIDLLLLDMNLTNKDYQDIIKYFLSNNELRNDFYCVASKDILNVLEKSKYDEIEELIDTNKESKDIINLTFEELIQSFLDKKTFQISLVDYQDKIVFNGNYQFQNNYLERLKNEET